MSYFKALLAANQLPITRSMGSLCYNSTIAEVAEYLQVVGKAKLLLTHSLEDRENLLERSKMILETLLGQEVKWEFLPIDDHASAVSIET